MHEFRDERTMGHVSRHWNHKIKGKSKRYGEKKIWFSGLLFFLSILEDGAFALGAAEGFEDQSHKKNIQYILFKVKIVFSYTHNRRRLHFRIRLL